MFFLFFLLALLATDLLFVLSLLLHECGHALAAQAMGMPVERVLAGLGPRLLKVRRLEIRLLPIVGVTVIPGLREASPTRRLIVALSGPIASLVAAIAFGYVALYSTGRIAHVAYIMGEANVALGLFNMLPIPMLDGWEVLEAMLEVFGVATITNTQRRKLRAVGAVALGLLCGLYVAWGWLH